VIIRDRTVGHESGTFSHHHLNRANSSNGEHLPKHFNLVNAMAVDLERGAMHVERTKQPDGKCLLMNKGGI
jgi:hypothetical protein